MSKDSLDQKVSYKDTLNLPHTDFPIRPDHLVDDAKMLARWEQENLANKAMQQNAGNAKYILHDGPPYANGSIHLGHAYNKILKDVMCKAQRMAGKHVPVIPGWDCHGLPIELKVSSENPGLTGQDLIKACRDYASKWVEVQKAEFKQLGILMDWENPYLTMSSDYEAKTLEAFGKFVQAGVIEKKNKTVPWCASCETVLASAEIEYEDRKDPSVYVKFPVVDGSTSSSCSQDQFVNCSTQALRKTSSGIPASVFANHPELDGKNVSLLVWTTTPWTLPLNRAVMIKPNTEYVVLQDDQDYLIVARDLADQICALKGIAKKIILQINSQDLIGKKAQHPFIADLQVPILGHDLVSLSDGTACVHCAPGCGPEDYEVGVKNNLEIFSPVNASGKYTNDILPKELVGMPVSDGQIWVIKELARVGNLYHKSSIRHSYPHCWRCHKGLIFRATSQWFCNLAKDGLKERALEALEQIEFIPARSKNSLRGAIEGRLEWCLSRQRTWGVPIVAALCVSCEQPYITPELIEQVIKGIAKAGIEYWRAVDLKTLLPKNLTCNSCGASDFKKELDILDVWFDSGISHYAVLFHNPEQHFPASLYLEGRDQARGWFQSSVLTSMVLEQTPPMLSIATHGFTVDGQGRKMSKSLGNVVAPQELIKELGTDGLRLWVASNDFASDPVVSPELLKNVKEVFRKIRNTLRFLVSNLHDFSPEEDVVDFEDLHIIDQYALFVLQDLSDKVRGYYDACKFTNVMHLLADYCATDLSAVYLDIIKDRLYVGAQDGLSRRAAQTICFYILSTLNKLTAPILSFTSEQVSDYYQIDKTSSIHLQQFAKIGDVWQELALLLDLSDNDNLAAWQEAWKNLFAIRDALLKSIEEQRALGLIKHPLEARLEIYLDQDNEQIFKTAQYVMQAGQSTGQDLALFLKEFLIVSQVVIHESPAQLPSSQLPGLFVKVLRASGEKCPRCWKYDENDHVHKLCRECQIILE